MAKAHSSTIRRELADIYNHMQKLSKALSIVEKSLNLDIEIPVPSDGKAKIKMSKAPGFKYLVVGNPATTAINFSATPVHSISILMRAKDGVLNYAKISSITEEGYYVADPISALALVASLAKSNKYSVRTNSEPLRVFIGDFLREMESEEVENNVWLLTREYLEYKANPSINVEVVVKTQNSERVYILYRASKIEPYIVISMPIDVADEEYIIPVLFSNGKKYALAKGSGMSINEAVEVLRKADVPGILASLEEVVRSFVTHYAKALIVARMLTL